MTSDIDKILTIVVQAIKALTSPWGIRFRPVPAGVEKHYVSSADGNRSADGVGSRCREQRAKKGGMEQGRYAVRMQLRTKREKNNKTDPWIPGKGREKGKREMKWKGNRESTLADA